MSIDSAGCLALVDGKETTLERADFTLQLLMFVTERREECLQFSFPPVFVSCCPGDFKLGQAKKAPASLPRSQLFLI